MPAQIGYLFRITKDLPFSCVPVTEHRMQIGHSSRCGALGWNSGVCALTGVFKRKVVVALGLLEQASRFG